MPPEPNSSDLLPLDLGTIKAGKVIDAANDAITRAIRDINQRPNLTKTREINVTIQLTPPDTAQDGIRTLDIAHRVGVKLPDEPMEKTVALLKRDGAFVSPLGANDIEQNLLPFAAGK